MVVLFSFEKKMGITDGLKKRDNTRGKSPSQGDSQLDAGTKKESAGISAGLIRWVLHC